MKVLVNAIARLIQAVHRVYARKWIFLVFFIAIFVGSVYILATLDLLPEAPVVTPALATVPIQEPVVALPVIEAPLMVEVPQIGLSVAIANPETTNVEALDTLLLAGAVRYPTSAKLGEEGNVVLFGHSSYLPVVKNQAYKAFNGIQKLVAGDHITVSSGTTVYTYVVRTMAKENAHNGAIPLGVSGKVLTLATCNSFGDKSDRFVVTADFVESHTI